MQLAAARAELADKQDQLDALSAGMADDAAAREAADAEVQQLRQQLADAHAAAAAAAEQRRRSSSGVGSPTATRGGGGNAAAAAAVDEVVAELEDRLLEAVSAKEEAERLAASTQKR
jgi:chromosome segregation ATPase